MYLERGLAVKGKLMKLSEYVDELESRGQCWLIKEEALAALACGEVALQGAMKRLIRNKRLVLVRAGFLVIIPTTYKNKGIIPADWFIEPLMEYLQIPYYIALLTAGSYYGAAHQKPQVFQVMVNQDLRKISKSQLRIEFYKKRDLNLGLTKKIQVHTGYAQIAVPELTALELVQYYRACGYLSNVATVLAELKEQLDPEKLFQLAISDRYDWAILQRLGYLMSLEAVGGGALVEPWKKLIQERKPRIVPLQPRQAYDQKQKDNEWRLWINEVVEVDE